MRCLGGPKSSKSTLLDWKQLFIWNQVFSGIFQFFEQNHCLSPFQNILNGDFLKKIFFIARKGLFYMKNITKHNFKAYFEEKWREEFSNFGTKIMGQRLCQKSKMAIFSKVYLYSLERCILYQENQNILRLSWAKVKGEEFFNFLIKIIC